MMNKSKNVILAALSPKYKVQFYGSNPDKGEICIGNVAAAFKEFLQFFYEKSVHLTVENIELMLVLAEQSLVDEFVEKCIDFLKEAITKFDQQVETQQLLP